MYLNSCNPDLIYIASSIFRTHSIAMKTFNLLLVFNRQNIEGSCYAEKVIKTYDLNGLKETSQSKMSFLIIT